MSEMQESAVTKATETSVPARAYAAMAVSTDLVPWDFPVVLQDLMMYR